MARGRGVIMQKYSGGQLADIKTFNLKEGLTWQSGDPSLPRGSAGRGRTRTETDIRGWKGDRAQAGKMVPTGFNRSGKF